MPCPGGPEQLDGRPAVKALSWAEVDHIISRFQALNPYDPAAVPGSILRLEDENFDQSERRTQLYCYAISAKRYALYNQGPNGEILPRKWSEHGLGHLLNPVDPDAGDRDWIKQVWLWILAEKRGDPWPDPIWLDRPALVRLTATGPHALRAFANFNQGRPYADQVKPLNFLIAGLVALFGAPDGYDPARFLPAAPYEVDLRRWRELPWFDRYSGDPVRVTTEGVTGESGVARVKTYREVLLQYRLHPEAKSLGPDGGPCGRRTEGLLTRRPLVAFTISYIGKEPNRLEEAKAGLIRSEGEVISDYADPSQDPWKTIVVPAMHLIPAERLAAASGLHPVTIKRLRNQRSQPRRESRDRVVKAVGALTRAALAESGVKPPRGNLACIYLFLKMKMVGSRRADSDK